MRHVTQMNESCHTMCGTLCRIYMVLSTVYRALLILHRALSIENRALTEARTSRVLHCVNVLAYLDSYESSKGTTHSCLSKSPISYLKSPIYYQKSPIRTLVSELVRVNSRHNPCLFNVSTPLNDSVPWNCCNTVFKALIHWRGMPCALTRTSQVQAQGMPCTVSASLSEYRALLMVYRAILITNRALIGLLW